MKYEHFTLQKYKFHKILQASDVMFWFWQQKFDKKYILQNPKLQKMLPVKWTGFSISVLEHMLSFLLLESNLI